MQEDLKSLRKLRDIAREIRPSETDANAFVVDMIAEAMRRRGDHGRAGPAPVRSVFPGHAHTGGPMRFAPEIEMANNCFAFFMNCCDGETGRRDQVLLQWRTQLSLREIVKKVRDHHERAQHDPRRLFLVPLSKSGIDKAIKGRCEQIVQAIEQIDVEFFVSVHPLKRSAKAKKPRKINVCAPSLCGGVAETPTRW